MCTQSIQALAPFTLVTKQKQLTGKAHIVIHSFIKTMCFKFILSVPYQLAIVTLTEILQETSHTSQD